ncbi:hypothetical protein [Mangrovimonas cancribranchiae]|uniref:Lipoprotein n=1 Tax=Mangrovimonas cancribranchiae TaxID=3080055 RepID=A0AAU6NZ16_9FLAO
MYRIIIIISILTLTISCKSKVGCGIDPLVIKSNDSIISKVESDSIGQKWWNNYLTKIKEPNLKTELNESYRLMIYNSMWESSKTYRIYKDSDSYKLVFKEFGGEQIERKNSTLTKNTESNISKEKWTDFQNLLENSGFWSLPVTIDRTGLDGTSWVLEGKNPDGNDCTNRTYHVVARWQPLDTMKVMELNYKLIEIIEK